MSNSFFHSKTPVIPENQIYLERPRLYRSMEKSLGSPLITVVAGAGYGKTSAVYLYLRRINAYTFWVQISKRDNLAFRFWENLTGVVASLNPELSRDLRELGFPYTQQQFDRYFATTKKAMVPDRNYVVVLDDFHLLDSAPIMRFIEWSAANPLFNFQIIIISRTEPALNLISLEAKGLVSDITVDDLRFSEQEIDEYYKLKNIIMLPEELKQFYRDTEGWAMALSVIAQNIRNSGDGKLNYSPSRIEMAAFEKIEEDYFTGIAGDLRKFLIKLSLIEHWPRELLEKIAADKRLIDGMETISPFIRYDAYLNSYLIHHLFIEFLKKKKNELNETEIREVYNVSAEWCAENNLLMDAALDYERARNYRGFRSLIYSLPLLLPDQAAEFLLEILNRLLETAVLSSPDSIEDLLVLRHKARPAFLLSLGRFEESAAFSREAIAQFEQLPPGPLRSWILMDAYTNLGVIAILSASVTKSYTFTPYFEKSLQYALEFPKTIESPRAQSNIYFYVCRVGYPAEKGEFERFLEALTPAVSLAETASNGFFYGLDTLARAEVAYYQGDLINAEKFALQAVYKARQKKQYGIESGGLFYLLRLSLHAGDGAKVRELFRQMAAQLEIQEYFNRFLVYDINTGWFYAHTGFSPPGKAERHHFPVKGDYNFDRSNASVSSSGSINAMFYSDKKNLIEAKNCYSLGQYDAALRVLDDFENDKNRPGDYALERIDRTVLKAVCLCLRNSAEKNAGSADTAPAEALRVLEGAYEMAVPNSLDMPFIELGRDMQLLAGMALNSRSLSIPRPWLETIRNRASVYGKKILLAMEEQNIHNPEQASDLTWREKEVLRALSRGWNREKIAGSLAISVNTVKAEISSAYAKLGAHNRADAMRIAAKLKIF
ncbi:MAG: LuxR C-terminal-related transcriptional regulator [Treponema sp.]|jgi:LuxR family maltose regulon positive regulatory protein|nr:LuxR C-terminal-related transcriptional regulator [Treponema sp.]